MKDSANIMKKEPKDVERINTLDRQFKGLGLKEMTPLKSNSSEFLELKNYLIVGTDREKCHCETMFQLSRTNSCDC